MQNQIIAVVDYITGLVALLGIVMPFIFYRWYIKRNGKNKWLIWPLLVLFLFCIAGAFVPFLAPFANFYTFFGSVVGVGLYWIAGGRKMRVFALAFLPAVMYMVDILLRHSL